MKKGLKVDFTENGGSLKTGESVSGDHTSIQNALMNIGTVAGTDKAFPAKGTDLFTTALKRGLPSLADARHAANFAAVDTLFFVRANEEATNDNSIKVLNISPGPLSLEKAEFDAYIETVGGKIYGNLSTTILSTGI